MQVLFVILFLFPRTAVAYALYSFSGLCVIKLSSKLVLYAGASILVLAMLFLVNSLFAKVSPTGFVIELILVFPFLLFLLGARISNKFDAGRILILLNLATFWMSIASLILQGFPIRLPYIHYPPDFYFAAYGLGGAKIVTVIGMFGLAFCLFSQEKIKRSYLIICALNFLAPSYIIGIICGLFAFSVAFYDRKYLKYYFLAVLVAILPLNYALYRFESLNQGLASYAGMHPKILSYYTVLMMFKGDPQTIIFGSGLGQFSSDAAIWSSDYGDAFFAGHSIPKLPGFYMSDYHDKYLGRWLDFGIDNSWAMRSSMNKPFTTISTLLAELGVPGFISVMVAFIYRFKRGLLRSAYTRLIIVFTLSLFLVDVWHDSIFIGWLLVLAVSAKQKCYLY